MAFLNSLILTWGNPSPIQNLFRFPSFPRTLAQHQPPPTTAVSLSSVNLYLTNVNPLSSAWIKYIQNLSPITWMEITLSQTTFSGWMVVQPPKCYPCLILFYHFSLCPTNSQEVIILKPTINNSQAQNLIAVLIYSAKANYYSFLQDHFSIEFEAGRFLVGEW